jgi:HKD family nuclease
MTKREFILQGFTTRTHAEAVRELFSLPNIEKVILSVAFVNDGGVELIETALHAHAGKATVFAGVRNDITSQQGLAKLLGMKLNLYAVDTGGRGVLFHPKLYMVRGKDSARLLMGSANLTRGGLHNNIEAGILIECDLKNADDKAMIDGIEKEFNALPTDYPLHVLKISALAELDAMLANGRLVDEATPLPPRPRTAAKTAVGDTMPRIKLKIPPIYRKVIGSVKNAKAKPKIIAPKTKTPAPILPSSVGVEYELAWESKPLAERDLNVPSGSNTNRTGSINLDKGLLPNAIDHRHYFREEVFSSLSWTPSSATVETGEAKFQLVLKTISYGTFDLVVRHTTGTTSKAYLQNNAMTRLSWGNALEHVARRDLIGRTLSLYRDKADATRFLLEID